MSAAGEIRGGVGGSRRRRPLRRLGVWTLVTLAVVSLLCVIAVLALTGRTLPLPGALTRLAETRLEAAFAPYQLTIGGGEVVVTRDGTPRFALSEVTIAGPGGEELVRVARLRVRMAPERLMKGQVVPTVFELSGGEIRLRRRADGEFDLVLGGGFAGQGSVSELLDRLDQMTAPGAPLAVLAYPDSRPPEQSNIQLSGGLPERLLTIGLDLFAYRSGYESGHGRAIWELVR